MRRKCKGEIELLFFNSTAPCLCSSVRGTRFLNHQSSLFYRTGKNSSSHNRESEMAQVVYTNTNGIGTANGSLFNGMKFWLSARVPMRGRFIEDIRVSSEQIALGILDMTALAGQWRTERATGDAG